MSQDQLRQAAQAFINEWDKPQEVEYVKQRIAALRAALVTQPVKMTKRKWRSGSPPHIGWWEASLNHEPHIWRWWGGRLWSHAVLEHTPHDAAAEIATMPVPEHMDEYIEWTNYYPTNARVPRIKP